MQSSKKNLILGAVRGYSFEQLRPFVASLKCTTFVGDLVLLWNNLGPETLAALGAHGVKLVHFEYRGSGSLNSWSRFWPVLAPIVRLCKGSDLARKIFKSILPLQSARFLAYRDFISAHSGEYNNVLITDVRDVFFQADPFYGFNGGLMVFEENGMVQLADEKLYNAKWVEELFGTEALAQIGRFPILCSGTIIGEAGAMIRYLIEFERLLCDAQNLGTGGSDQGLHNYLCRSKTAQWIQIAKNGEGPILTMVPTLRQGVDFNVSDSGLVLNSAGSPVKLLHQYDRHPELATRLIRKLGFGLPLSNKGIVLHED